MDSLHQDVLRELGILQLELQTQGLWSDLAPSEDALLSAEPFCADTMSLGEWLQWIFIPRLSYLAENGENMPNKSGILPMAEEAFKDLEGTVKGLLASISRMDALLTA
ncbi:MAG: YqcC family protein [Gammaproteobacteria bacterium]|nr:YqcC family protein [Gammaproteobacteria bacterium]